MSEKLSISLVNLRFWAYHGVFPEEKILGNWFTISLEVRLHKNREIKELHHTLDYGTLFEIVKQEMSIPTELLEVLAQKIKDRIIENYQEVNHFCLEIQKQKPAVGLIDGNSLIKLEVEL